MPPLPGRSARGVAVDNHLSRRAFIRIGSLGVGGLTLANLLQAEASAGVRSSRKSVILIYLVGGPPHQDMFDLKPDAPKEYAGPWKPIATNVTGVRICEAFPRLAKSATAHADGSLSPGVDATYFTTPRPVYELYDLEADPSELENLSGSPGLAEVERAMREALAEKMILDFDYLPLPAPLPGAEGRAGKKRKTGQ